MGSMNGKHAKIDAAFGRLADMTQSEHLRAVADIIEFLDIMVTELKDLRSECEMLRSIINTLNGDNGERLTDLLEMYGRGGAACKAYTLREVIGDAVLSDAVLSDAVLSDWAQWVTIDADGEVWEYAEKPTIANGMWNYLESGRLRYIGRATPPLNFKNCIWEIKNGN